LVDATNEPSFDRELTPYSEGMYYLSEKFQESRQDSFYVIKEGEPYPTLHRRCWFFHENKREFSLREYASVQQFPEDYIFVGSKEEISKLMVTIVTTLLLFMPCTFVCLTCLCKRVKLRYDQKVSLRRYTF